MPMKIVSRSEERSDERGFVARLCEALRGFGINVDIPEHQMSDQNSKTTILAPHQPNLMTIGGFKDLAKAHLLSESHQCC